MVDRLRVQRLLRRMTDELDVLGAESAADGHRRADSMWLRGVKYSFVSIIESCVDIAQHLCAASGWGPPADNGDAIRLLGVHQVLDPHLADSMRRAVGFRNILVHEYANVDDEIVVERLTDLSPIQEFITAIANSIRDD